MKAKMVKRHLKRSRWPSPFLLCFGGLLSTPLAIQSFWFFQSISTDVQLKTLQQELDRLRTTNATALGGGGSAVDTGVPSSLKAEQRDAVKTLQEKEFQELYRLPGSTALPVAVSAGENTGMMGSLNAAQRGDSVQSQGVRSPNAVISRGAVSDLSAHYDELVHALDSIQLEQCKAIYLDIGSNRGLQTRKLFLPQCYSEAKVQPVFNKFFGHVSQRKPGDVCVLGIEPNPNHQPSLNQIVREFSGKGERVHFLTRTAISDEAAYKSFMLEQRDSKLYHELQTGATLFPERAASALQRRPWGGTVASYKVTVLDLGRVAGLVRQRARQGAPIVMKLDVEGAEYGALSSLMVSGALCGVNVIMYDIHAAPPGYEKVPSDWIEALQYTIAHAPQCNTELAELDDETYSEEFGRCPDKDRQSQRHAAPASVGGSSGVSFNQNPWRSQGNVETREAFREAFQPSNLDHRQVAQGVNLKPEKAGMQVAQGPPPLSGSGPRGGSSEQLDKPEKPWQQWPIGSSEQTDEGPWQQWHPNGPGPRRPPQREAIGKQVAESLKQAAMNLHGRDSQAQFKQNLEVAISEAGLGGANVNPGPAARPQAFDGLSPQAGSARPDPPAGGPVHKQPTL